LWALGVAYVISGDYFGWNFGLRPAGHGGLLVATFVMALLYTALIFTIAELATATPVAGGAFAFARRALGPLAGFVTGLAVAIEYTIAPAVIASAMAGYVSGFVEGTGIAHELVAIAVPGVGFAACIAVNLAGVAVSLRALFVVTAIAAAALVVWATAIAVELPASAWARLGTITEGVAPAGVIAALPAAGWFFLAIEGVPMAAEETRDPSRDLPRGMAWAMATLVVLALVVGVLAPLASPPEALATATAPLSDTLVAVCGKGTIHALVTAVALLGLFASMLSIVYAGSRQVYALARGGHFPQWLAATDRRAVPSRAVIVVALVGWAALLVTERIVPADVPAADVAMQVAVFAALVSYVAIATSHLVLRRRAPDLPRPYRTPGGVWTSGTALVLSCVALVSGVAHGAAGTTTSIVTVAVLVAGTAWWWIAMRPRIVGRTLEQELAIVRAAETDGPR
jgi:ethanolamine permease